MSHQPTTNQAAWLTGPKAKPFKIDAAPMPQPDADEVVLRNHAAAINPVDWKMQDADDFPAPFPSILGADVAGEIVAVGSNVTRFQKGDRVIAHCDGLMSRKATNNGFQLFCATTQKLVAKLPDHIDYVHGGVLPLAISTAAAGLFQKQALALPYPVREPKASNKVLVIWGGSSSVGSVTIQLAVAAGVEVATVASARNHDYMRKLGAKYVFDYNMSDVIEEIVAALGEKDSAGVYDAISTESTLRDCVKIAGLLKGKKKVAAVLPVPESVKSDEVETEFVIAPYIVRDGTGKAVWEDYVPGALADGTLQCSPEPLVVGKGLEKLQEGCDMNRAGVSARKVMVELP